LQLRGAPERRCLRNGSSNANRHGRMTGWKGLSKARALWSSLAAAGASGCFEIMAGAWHWRVWHLLGARDLQHRYARSRLGQFWLVFSTAIIVGALAMVWSVLSNQPVGELVPFIGTGIVIWNYFSQVLIDCTTVFAGHGHLYRNQRMNFSVSIYSIIYKNTIIFAHSMIIVVGLIVLFQVPVNWYDLQIVPAFVLTWITMLWAGYVVAMVCVRYRDIIQLINSWLLVLFFVTPVLWKPDLLPANYRVLSDYNPFSQFMELLRNPLLGEPVGASVWLSTIAIAFGGTLLAMPVIGRYRQRVIFWT
jgi:ABC-type polysaccharide/polyol phosphate export permease